MHAFPPTRVRQLALWLAFGTLWLATSLALALGVEAAAWIAGM
jgi:hypothetical protein